MTIEPVQEYVLRISRKEAFALEIALGAMSPETSRGLYSRHPNEFENKEELVDLHAELHEQFTGVIKK